MPMLTQSNLQQLVLTTFAFGWIGILTLVIASAMLNGDINVREVLEKKPLTRTGEVSPERVQLMVVTIAAAATYLTKIPSWTDPTKLPDFDRAWLVAASASNGIYMVGKGLRVLKTWMDNR